MRSRSAFVGSRGGFALAAVVLASGTARAETYKVTTTDDSGPGSLRAAIVAANQRLGSDRIKFDLPGSGPYVIKLDSKLPTIVDALVIDGSTQPGFTNFPLVIVDGGRIGGAKVGFTLAAERCGIIGLSLAGWGIPTDGTGIVVSGANCLVAGCYVGVKPSSTTWWGDANGIRVQGTGCVIEDCVVSGNENTAILFEPTASGGAVRHNVIGPYPSGLARFGNGAPILIYAPNVTVGGDPEDCNLIAGNNAGIEVTGAQASGVVIESNWIGLDATGKVALTNFGTGITLSHGANGCTIRRNVVSGNSHGGISLYAKGTTGNVVAENLVGLDASGTLPIGNGSGGGIGVSYDASQNTIGPLNVVSGHDGFGIDSVQHAPDNLIAGNLIGSDPTGEVWFGNGGGVALDYNPGATRVVANLIVAPIGGVSSSYAGVHVTGGRNHLIDANVIRSHSYGVLLEFRARDCVVSGNEIADSRAYGILAYEQSFNVDIVGNAITRSAYSGILVNKGWDTTPQRITIRGNSLFENAELAIDLGPKFGLNDDDVRDGDTGPNGLQNRPVLDLAYNEADGLHVDGRLNSKPQKTYVIDLYGCTSADPEAEVQLATFTVTTDAAGDAAFQVVVPSWMQGLPVSATATDDLGNTSEVGWVLVSSPFGGRRDPQKR